MDLKRKRATRACDSCHRKKVKCNGDFPVCDVCLKGGKVWYSYAENYMQFNTSNSLSSPAHMYGTARSEVQEMRILDNLLYMKTLGALL